MFDNDDKLARQRTCISPLSTRPVLYTDTIQGGNQAMRDDLWAVSTDELNKAAQDALDAARYRWLRDRCPDLEGMTSAWLYGDFDKEVDAAIAAEKAAP